MKGVEELLLGVADVEADPGGALIDLQRHLQQR